MSDVIDLRNTLDVTSPTSSLRRAEAIVRSHISVGLFVRRVDVEAIAYTSRENGQQLIWGVLWDQASDELIGFVAEGDERGVLWQHWERHQNSDSRLMRVMARMSALAESCL